MKVKEDSVRAENSFSNFDKSDVSQFMEEKSRFDEENELLAELKTKPMLESEVSELISRGKGKIESAERLIRLTPILNKLRSDKLIIPDPPQSLAEFQKKNEGYSIIKTSLLQQLSISEYDRFQSKGKFRVFNDIPDGSHVKHLQYWERNGTMRQSGYGMNIEIIPMNEPGKEDLRMFAEAEKRYKKAREEIKKLFNSLGLTLDGEQIKSISGMVV